MKQTRAGEMFNRPVFLFSYLLSALSIHVLVIDEMFSAADQSVPLAVLHGDGPGGHHYRVVRHQHAFTSQEGPAVPRVRRGQGDLPPAPCLPHPAAGAHLPLWDVSLQVSDVMNRII